jgi:hypothetical protein
LLSGFVETLPCFFIHGQPVIGNLSVDVAVANGSPFESYPERLSCGWPRNA